MGYCKNCGGKLEDNAKFCVLCGTKVETEGEVVQPTPAEQPVVEEQQPVKEYVIDEQPTQEPVVENKPVEQETPVLQQAQPTEDNTSLLDNPANYPNGKPTQEPIEASQQDVVVPANANIDISRTIEEDARHDAMNQLQITPEEKPIQQKQISRPTASFANKANRKKKPNGSQVIHTIALIIGSLLALVVIGFLFTFGLSYLNELNKGGGQEGPKLELNSKNSYRVGSKDYGYVSVPNSWSPFGLSPENQTIQYTDGTGWIVTLYSVDQNTISAKNWANNIIAQMNSVGASDIGMEETKINDLGGFKIFGYYSNVTTYLAAWVLNGNDGKIHYVAIEGPERYNEFYDIIYTFDPAK